MVENEEFSHAGTNFVAITLAVIVVIALVAWGVIHWGDFFKNSTPPGNTQISNTVTPGNTTEVTPAQTQPEPRD